MIDFSADQPFPISDIRDHLPRKSGGKKFSVATAYRWATKGVRGVVLETIRVGGSRCTTLGALQRFFTALSESDPCVRRKPADTATHKRRVAAANRALDKAGV